MDGGAKEWQPLSAGSQAAVVPSAFVAPLLASACVPPSRVCPGGILRGRTEISQPVPL